MHDQDLEQRVEQLESDLAQLKSVLKALHDRIAANEPVRKGPRRPIVNDLQDAVSRSLDGKQGDSAPPKGPQC